MNKLVIYPQCYYSFLIDVALRYCSLIVIGSSNYSPGKCTPQLNDHGDEQVYVRMRDPTYISKVQVLV